MIYLWLKALHVIAIIAWMAALLYLPRLMVYHVAAEPGSVQSETFKVMERRLLKAIANPAMMAAWVLGLSLATYAHLWSSGWLHAKLAAVLVLTFVHTRMARWVDAFAADQNTHSARFYRMMNEVPTVLMIAIVILVILKPF
ncbi:protoporphyrinogen oxidase HemJ [Acuticoccus mangrovi]|uniref:Protoporphyrinogen IX oxidase n=1 Tax=Acuticoccus mangrovi TaxID=2796142 RepID=A0A934IS82_9HYPH|nr:protoporphyrinogen oxidase HemJ [Acuticoccus mangrovi]MBJ3777816.1 protoporphyrinogen oxidase HemJ [Acuticoccus mangrovi]